MEQFSLLIKPASADCNLRCQYCFYLEHASLFPETKVHRMSEKTLSGLISSYMSTNQDQYAFGWQGGEPTLMGLDFFRRVTDLQQKYGREGAIVSNGLQTNATLIHDTFARHLAEYNFLVGVSLDGPAQLHDFYRKKRNGSASHEDVLRGIKRLEENRVEFNILILVNKLNADKAVEVYNYLCENGWFYHQYIPCVEFGQDGQLLPFSITGEDWGDFLCALFDEWYKSDITRVSIRLFDSILAYLVAKQRTICHMGLNCCQYFVVEYNGDIFPCDFFVKEDLRLGNVLTHSWEQLAQHKDYISFGSLKTRWNTACADCLYQDICAGDCLKHRLNPGNEPRTLSWLCSGWKQFYKHSLPYFRQIAEDIKRDRQQVRPSPPPAFKEVGRNDPCPCGSGKKYKKCCLNRQTP
ncbi:MAG: anaerobic sulfatase maturase [Deltaproteobacteria bacterium]|nr:anaerobic sulfatase maturase [Deltaproteobacteria bacterium]